MSDRRVARENDRATEWMKQVEQRLWRLENGGATAGIISVGNTFIIGNVQIQVVDAGGENVDLVFTNLTTGATSTTHL